LCVLLVIAMMITSDESLLYLSELIITAGLHHPFYRLSYTASSSLSQTF
jgi:hypothetical protein